jgi:hypothetical protein
VAGRWVVSLVAALLALNACGSSETSQPGPLDPGAAARPDLVVAEPSAVAAGGFLELTFPKETDRGLPWVLELQEDNTWHARYLLSSDANGTAPSWVGADEPDKWAWEDVGVSGPGPDAVLIPDVAAPGRYRLCTANAQDNLCAEIEITC